MTTGVDQILIQQGYSLIRTLGYGAYSTVKLFHSEKNKRDVVVKVYPPLPPSLPIIGYVKYRNERPADFQARNCEFTLSVIF